MPLSAWTLVRVGLVAGLEVAEEVYRALHREPIDPDGSPVDWLVVRARIIEASARR